MSIKIALCVAEDMNLGVGYLISFLKRRGNEVRLFFDPRHYNIESYLINQIINYKPSIIGFSCITANFGWALNLARKLKTKLSCPIVFGGVHPTLCPEQVEKEGFQVCIGDGIKYFGGDFNPDQIWSEREMFLEQLPPIHRKIQMFLTGFGCPFRCSFCNNHQLHQKIIKRDSKNCIEELKLLKSRGMRYVLFNDDIFTIRKKWLLKFLFLYHKEIDLPFTCFGHPKFLDEEIVRELKKSGCQMVWLGIQTADEFIRKHILNRYETNREIRNSCKLIRDNGLRLMIDHIFGIPYDDFPENSYKFYKELKPDVVNCYELLYFPKAEINKYGSGTAFYQNQGGEQYKKYAKSFCVIPLMVN